MSECAGQMTMFTMLGANDWYEGRLRELLKGYAHRRDDKIRIYIAAERLDRDRLADYLQNEFDVQGHSVEGGFIDFSFRGADVRKWKEGKPRHFTWAQIRNIVLEMIADGDYMTEKDWDRLAEVQRIYGGQLPLVSPRMAYREEEE